MQFGDEACKQGGLKKITALHMQMSPTEVSANNVSQLLPTTYHHYAG